MTHILGQSEALELLRRAWHSSRMHHAWIFAGPRGVGKCTTAIELAAALLDPDLSSQATDPFDIDPKQRTYRQVAEGNHPDLHVIQKELALFSDNPALRSRKLMNIPLDLLRERMLGGRTADDRSHEPAAYRTPVEGYAKVFIIDEAELLEPIAQNALLKTLEEPPAATFFFLITSRPDRLLPTIRSRCHLVRFNRLSDQDMASFLTGPAFGDLDPQERAWIEGNSAGSPGNAALAAEYGFAHWQQQLEPHLAQLEAGRFPVGMGETLSDLVDEFARQWVKQHDNASKDAANKDGARHMLGLLARIVRTQLHSACAAGIEPNPWLAAADLLQQTERQLDRNVNMKLALENLAVQWHACTAAPEPQQA
jgi:DNA polymerase-3 subunit delta'